MCFSPNKFSGGVDAVDSKIMLSLPLFLHSLPNHSKSTPHRFRMILKTWKSPWSKLVMLEL